MNDGRMLLVAGWLCAGTALPAGAETLQQALAYDTNPVLHGQQATQRATGETVEQARSGWRPVVSATVSAEYQRQPYDTVDYALGTIQTKDAQAALTVTQPLHTGGRVGSAVRAVGARTRAAQQGVRLAEAQTFQTAIGALHGRAARPGHPGSAARRPADARAAGGGNHVPLPVRRRRDPYRRGAGGGAARRRGGVASHAGYRTAVGIPPGPLLQPGALPGLPATLDQALAAARTANPALAEDQALADASGADIASADAAFAPQVGVQAAFGYIARPRRSDLAKTTRR